MGSPDAADRSGVPAWLPLHAVVHLAVKKGGYPVGTPVGIVDVYDEGYTVEVFAEDYTTLDVIPVGHGELSW